MKKLFTFLMMLTALSLASFAQNPMDQIPSAVSQATAQMPGISSVLTDLGTGLKPESLLSSFKMPDWLKSVSALKSTDVSTAAALLSQLGNGLKSSSLLKGFSLKDWSSKLKSATSLSSIATEAESLVKNISPSAFKSGFDVSKLTSSLDMLKAAK